MRQAGTWLIGAAVAAAAAFALYTAPDTPPPLMRGSAAPDFALTDLAGKQISLDGLRGQVVLVNFWATWCKPCEEEMPAMERLHQRMAGQGFQLLAISEDDERSTVEAYRKRLGLSFPILLDADKQISERYQTYRFPESFLIGRDGVVVERYIGPKDWDSEAYVARIRRLVESG